jgi:CheY-like chemotaxis protein
MTAQTTSAVLPPRCTILYVEDDDVTAYLFQKALEGADIKARLIRVTDGEEGAAFLRRQGMYVEVPTTDLIILDANLPKKNGLEVRAEAWRIETLKSVLKVMFSSSTSPPDSDKAVELGGDKFFSKDRVYSLIDTAKQVCSMLREDIR